MDDLENGQDQNLEQQQQSTQVQAQDANEPKTSLEALERSLLPQGDDQKLDNQQQPNAQGANKQEPIKQEPQKPVEDDPYKMPEGLQEKSQQRFSKLVEMNQQKDAQIQQLQPVHNWINDNFGKQQGGYEALQQFADYFGAINTGDYQKAGQILQAQLQQYTLLTGQQLQISPLADFPELQQQVDNFEIAEQTALEIARYRKQEAMLSQQQQQGQIQAQQQQQFEQEVNQAEQQILGMINEWKAADIDFPAKEKAIADFLGGLQGVRPSAVPNLIKRYYASLGAITQATQKPTQSQQPLRATGKGAGNAVPKNSLEAIGAALGYDV